MTGGAESVIDASTLAGQAAIREGMRKWPKRFRAITPERKDRWVKGLDTALDVGEVAAAAVDLDERMAGANLIVSAVRTGVQMETLHQKDDHAEAGINEKGTVNNFNGPAVVFIRGVPGDAV